MKYIPGKLVETIRTVHVLRRKHLCVTIRKFHIIGQAWTVQCYKSFSALPTCQLERCEVVIVVYIEICAALKQQTSNRNARHRRWYIL
jgi:hypothetical protein